MKVIERFLTVQGEDFPTAGRILLPIEGGRPTQRLNGVPAVGEPEFRALIAAVFDEAKVLCARYRPRSEAKGLKKSPMTGKFVVEAKTIAAIADFDQAAGVVQPLVRPGVVVALEARFRVGGEQRVGPESVLDVGRDQLLVLLLVMHSQFDAAMYLRGCTRGQQLHYAVFDVTPVLLNLLQRGT